jgi:transforming growth factor-beta-induced protein
MQPLLQRVVSIAALGALALTACGSDDDGVSESDVEEAADEAGAVVTDAAEEIDATTVDLESALRDNGLDSLAGIVEQVDVSELIGTETFTFFAPNDEAFTTLSAEQTADLLTDPSQILDTLRNHTVESTVNGDELTSMDQVSTAAGETLEVSVDGETVMVGDVLVVTTDIEVGDGVIHVVDGFLIP